MYMEKKQLYFGIFIVAILICILSPFLASGDPDGLEASAEHLNPDSLEASQVITPIMPDYTLEGMESSCRSGMFNCWGYYICSSSIWSILCNK